MAYRVLTTFLKRVSRRGTSVSSFSGRTLFVNENGSVARDDLRGGFTPPLPNPGGGRSRKESRWNSLARPSLHHLTSVRRQESRAAYSAPGVPVTSRPPRWRSSTMVELVSEGERVGVMANQHLPRQISSSQASGSPSLPAPGLRGHRRCFQRGLTIYSACRPASPAGAGNSASPP